MKSNYLEKIKTKLIRKQEEYIKILEFLADRQRVLLEMQRKELSMKK